MSAASPQVQDKAGEKAHEPSMEEILASIRRIIADDQAAKPPEAPEVPEAPEPAADDMDDILDLAEVAEPVARPEPPEPPAAAVRPPEPPKPVPLDLEELDFRETPEPVQEKEPEPVRRPPPPIERAQEREPEPIDHLISAATDASVSNAFNLLAHTVLTQNSRTLEDLVKDMLRPMLKAWLDDNLPVVVERLVRAEIERVSRGR